MSIYYLDNDNEWASTNNSSLIKVEEMLQRMQTWKGEKSFNANDGVNYLGVLNRQDFLKPQLENIAADYSIYFDTTIQSVEIIDENIAVELLIVLKSGQAIARTLEV